jgi:hypothetical protein
MVIWSEDEDEQHLVQPQPKPLDVLLARLNTDRVRPHACPQANHVEMQDNERLHTARLPRPTLAR